ncbi:hypothetical protein FRX31_030585 [Thalictrum thalictroides]|uniref:Uncharacterized protein n=1 Tax=Thalictrum thalictroides TaxID=46969 RepID=A0A7J6V574_THATH|nr:hypothetical protein FRX31_030585 [Thalictrum thalictroides]
MAVPLNTWVLISNFKLAYTKLEVRPSFLQLQQPLSSDVVVPVLIILHLQVLLKFPDYILLPNFLRILKVPVISSNL